MTEAVFLQDFTILMAIAGVAALVCQRFGWPRVIGYLLTGVLMGQYTWGGSFLEDGGSITIIGQLGIVFLMFTLGLEFSVRQMREIKSVAGPMAVLDTIVMIWLGYTVGTRVFGWGNVQSLFLGAAICDSATTLLVKTIDEMGWGKRPFVKYVIGTSVIEDILCVGVIALVSGVANGAGMSLRAVSVSLAGLALFFVAILVFGLVLVPRLLNVTGKSENDETLLLAVLGICFVVSFVAYRLGYSLALGAFLSGFLCACSDMRNRIVALAAPLRNMFAAVFFVTTGALIDPLFCLKNIGAILLLSAVVMGGKGLNNFVASLLAGCSVKTCVQSAFGLAQIGEFAFMVAMLYASTGAQTDCPMYQIVVGVSLLTTVLNPFMLRLSDPVSDWVDRRIPRRLRKRLDAYAEWLDRFRSTEFVDNARVRMRRSLLQLALVAALVFAVSLAAHTLDDFDYRRFSTFFDAHKTAFWCLVANLVYLWLAVYVPRTIRTLGRAVTEILTAGRRDGGEPWRTAVGQTVRFFVTVLVAAAMLLEVVMVNLDMLPPELPVRIGMLVAVVALAVVFGKRFKSAAYAADRYFTEALTAEARMAQRAAHAATSSWEGNVLKVALEAGSPAVGGTLATLGVRARTGASVVSVLRDGEKNRNPGPDWRFEPGDVVYAIGQPAQLAAFRELFGASA